MPMTRRYVSCTSPLSSHLIFDEVTTNLVCRLLEVNLIFYHLLTRGRTGMLLEYDVTCLLSSIGVSLSKKLLM
jgi:hypothetical protein